MREAEIAKHFVNATVSILGTMACIEARPGKPFVKKDNTVPGDITAIINVTGPKNGIISVSFPRTSAENLVYGMLGDMVDNMEQDMQDTVGEVANMISGQARASIAAEGLVMQGSTPSVIIGRDNPVDYMDRAPVMAIPFETPKGGFIVEFCLA